ncbi:MAG: hypothetical protein KatS3mg043_0789 [Rhodothermaceae bacterium]|nr:MAG: hypothetical protein KatS3mg043_0789 [Rhodothermaceae bacterium]
MDADLPATSPARMRRASWNRMQYRPLEGLRLRRHALQLRSPSRATCPRRPPSWATRSCGNRPLTAVYSAYFLYKLLEEAGLPPGVINMVPGHGPDVGDTVFASPHLAGLHFTGSTETFRRMWRTIGQNIDRYRAYPRIVGETGGKDFIVAHVSADPAGRRHGHRARQLRISGPEVLGGLARLSARYALAAHPRVSARPARRGEDGHGRGLHELHQRRHRHARPSTRSSATSKKPSRTRT